MQMYVYSVYVYYTQELMFSFRIWIQQIFQAFYQIFARTATTENVGEEKSSIFLWKGLKKVRQNRSRILRKDSDHDRLKVKLSAKFGLLKNTHQKLVLWNTSWGNFCKKKLGWWNERREKYSQTLFVVFWKRHATEFWKLVFPQFPPWDGMLNISILYFQVLLNIFHFGFIYIPLHFRPHSCGVGARDISRGNFISDFFGNHMITANTILTLL